MNETAETPQLNTFKSEVLRVLKSTDKFPSKYLKAFEFAMTDPDQQSYVIEAVIRKDDEQNGDSFKHELASVLSFIESHLPSEYAIQCTTMNEHTYLDEARFFITDKKAFKEAHPRQPTTKELRAFQEEQTTEQTTDRTSLIQRLIQRLRPQK